MSPHGMAMAIVTLLIH